MQSTLTADDQTSGALPIGFAFPFYGGTFSSFRVCTNGWISLTNGTLTSYTNTPLPNNGTSVPENLIAPFWDDLDFGALPHVYYRSQGDSLVIQYR